MGWLIFLEVWSPDVPTQAARVDNVHDAPLVAIGRAAHEASGSTVSTHTGVLLKIEVSAALPSGGSNGVPCESHSLFILQVLYICRVYFGPFSCPSSLAESNTIITVASRYWDAFAETAQLDAGPSGQRINSSYFSSLLSFVGALFLFTIPASLQRPRPRLQWSSGWATHYLDGPWRSRLLWAGLETNPQWLSAPWIFRDHDLCHEAPSWQMGLGQEVM